MSAIAPKGDTSPSAPGAPKGNGGRFPRSARLLRHADFERVYKREAVRQRRQACSVPVDVVINPKKSLLTAEFSQLLEEVGRAFEVIQQKLTEKPRGQG